MDICKKTICLNMIVKNESHVIKDTLVNLLKYIRFDYWVISDTGSTDDTIKIIKDFFEIENIPGELVEEPWKDFGYNRTKALEAAYNKTDYLFIFDADDRIHGEFKLPDNMNLDGYLMKFGTNFVYNRMLIVNNRKKWKFIGVLHEYIKCTEDINSHGLLDGNYYVESGRTGNRSKDPDKYKKDALILKKGFEEEQDEALKHRYAFYCAQSYNNCGEIDNAIEWYSKCLDFEMWKQEKFYSALTLGNIYFSKNDYINALKFWLKTVEYDSERIEGIVHACEYYRNNNVHILVNLLYNKFKNYHNQKNLKNKLFVATDLYNYILEYNNSISACYVDDKQSGYDCCKLILLNHEKIHPLILNSTIHNFKFYESYIDSSRNNLFEAVDDILFNYAKSNTPIIDQTYLLWEKLFDKTIFTKYKKYKHNNKNNPNIILTITSCKRYDLFKQTVNSIINTWNDIDKVDYWFCVDDNSSKDDRNNMKSKYNWIEFYMKTPDEIGHRESMNIIWNKLNELKPKYWIHIEDDFLFYKKMNYITKAIEYIKKLKSENVYQVLFNRNYAEVISGYKILGHKAYDDEIVFHECKEGNFNYPNCHYWPHYSFRPSVTLVEPILKLGNFNSDNTFFERDYANKWFSFGYKSVFFNRITCKHIGRLTGEKNNKNAFNAYQLNNQEQFNENKSKIIKIINLERRKDRKEKTEQLLINNNIKNYEFFQAIDGLKLQPSIELLEIFNGNDFAFNKGVIGCALSHIKLWEALINDSSTDYYVIMEDDITFCNNFKLKLDSLVDNFKTKDIVFIGYHMFDSKRKLNKNIYDIDTKDIKLDLLNKDLYIGGFFSYSINKNGAKKLLEYISKNGVKHGIDYLVKIIPDLNNYETQPLLVYSEWNEASKDIDTDIQNKLNPIDFTDIINDFKNDMDQFIFIQQVDQINYDLYRKNEPIHKLLKIAINDPNVIAFNSLGFFKNKIDKLEKSNLFKKNQGIYIKKSMCNNYILNQNYKRIKLIGHYWPNNNYIYDNHLQITSDDNNIDYYVIINKPNDTFYDASKTLVFQMEPYNTNTGRKTWGNWSIPDSKNFLYINDSLNVAQWNFNLPNKIKKTRFNLAIILSNRNIDEGQKKRISFTKYLDNNSLIDVYGKENYHQLNNYISSVPDEDRSNILKSYKYYLAIENSCEENYATEKIWEAILCECLCFYWGCPNLEKYIDPLSFIRLDLDNYDESINIIKKAIEEDLWSKRIKHIRNAKQQILSKYGFFPKLNNIIKKLESNNCYICGCVKNNANYLYRVFNNIEKIITLFDDYKIIIAYDHSKDESLKILEEMKNKFNDKFELIICNNKEANVCENISKARNAILDYIKRSNTNFNYLIMMDMDDVCAIPINIEIVQKSLERNDWDMLSFNRPGYYDIWALSIYPYVLSCWHWHPNSTDVINKMRDYTVNKLNKLKDNELLECLSAFNGFGIYRRKKFIDCYYDTNYQKNYNFFDEQTIKNNIDNLSETNINKSWVVDCEHRHFHLQAIKKHNARIRISPQSIFEFDETTCQYVCSRGLLKLCDIKSNNPISSINYLLDYNFADIRDGSIIYVCNNALKEFIQIIPRINNRFVLVTGDADETIPDDIFNFNDFIQFIRSEKIVHWFSQNCIVKHPKVTALPIGLDYHTIAREKNHNWGERLSPFNQEIQLNYIKNNSKPFWDREIKCYSNFHFFTTGRYGYDRKDAIEKIPKNLVYYEPTKIKRLDSWNNQSKYAFVISPHGNGLDCHRTWEALALGCIPIVKKSQIDILYDNLPVLIVNEWDEVTYGLLKSTIEKFKILTFEYKKLTLEYWKERITKVYNTLIPPVKNSIISKKNGRLGNSIFIYIACILLNLKYNFKYVESKLDYKYYIDLSKISSNKFNIPRLSIYEYNYLEYLFNDDYKFSDIQIYLDGFFQFDYIYLKNKSKIIEEINKNKESHYLIDHDNNKILLNDVINSNQLSISKIYDIVIHIRLTDFNGIIDFIELEYYLQLFEKINSEFYNKKIAILSEKLYDKKDCDYIESCLKWFKDKNFNINYESNDLFTDFAIMKNAKILICSMSTFSWIAAYFSNNIEKCYMPNYNFYKNNRPNSFFKKPIKNTILYSVKTTKFQDIKSIIINNTIIDTDKLSIKLSMIGLQYEIISYLPDDIVNLESSKDTFNKIKHLLIIDDRLQSIINFDKLYNILDAIPNYTEKIMLESIYENNNLDIKAYLLQNN